jgi:hypothetical protein
MRQQPKRRQATVAVAAVAIGGKGDQLVAKVKMAAAIGDQAMKV